MGEQSNAGIYEIGSFEVSAFYTAHPILIAI